MIEGVLKHALDKEKKIFDKKSAIFKYLDKAKVPTDLIYDNTDEIESIWKALSGIPPSPSSELLEAPPQDPETEEIHRVDRDSRGLKVPVFDRDTEPVAVLITLHDSGRFSHANTKHCEGVESYIKTRTVQQNRLQREDDGTVIVAWKDLKYQQTTNETYCHTRCWELEGEDAEAMQVDILWGSGHEAGVTYPPRSSPSDSGLPQPTSPPQTLQSQTMDSSAGIISNGTISPWNHGPVFIQNIYIGHPGDRMPMGQFPAFPVPYFGAGQPNGNIIPAAPGSSIADYHAVGPMANSPVAGMNGSNAAGYVLRDPSGRQGKRKADDEAGGILKAKRPTTTNRPPIS
ncbi:hypothetical protein F5Y05DRAFT_420883 [Hypoxylon sp. FL0543]|nr:hypothetical protein F5Y05DRAFT_420883 [Hypoxylon sp. FL0543]